MKTYKLWTGPSGLCSLLPCCPAPGLAVDCYKDTISGVSRSFDLPQPIVEMQSGQLYEVAPLDEFEADSWMSADEVVICEKSRGLAPYTIINLDERFQIVGAKRLH